MVGKLDKKCIEFISATPDELYLFSIYLLYLDSDSPFPPPPLCFLPGSLIFVKWNQDFWCRANVVEIMQKGCMEAVKVCPVNQLASIQVFFLDYGFTKSITIQRYTTSK